MATFREVRGLVISSWQNIITAEEYFLLNYLNTSKNVDFPYCQHDSFELDLLTNAECKSEFRFYRNDIYRLAEVLNIPDEIVCYNWSKFNGIEAFCIFLKRFAYPCWYSNIIQRCGRSVLELCLMSNAILNKIFDGHFHLLRDFQQIWPLLPNLRLFSEKVHAKGAALDNCWEFMDGTVRPLCRPTNNQRALFNGHKRIHAIKFWSVAAVNGIIVNLHGPVWGKTYDGAMSTMSNVYNQMFQYSRKANGEVLCIYGGPTYPLHPQLQDTLKNQNLTPQQADFNNSISALRTLVE